MGFPKDGKLDKVSSGDSFQLSGCGVLDKSSSLTIVFIFFPLSDLISIASAVSFLILRFLTPEGNINLCVAAAELT